MAAYPKPAVELVKNLVAAESVASAADAEAVAEIVGVPAGRQDVSLDLTNQPSEREVSPGLIGRETTREIGPLLEGIAVSARRRRATTWRIAQCVAAWSEKVALGVLHRDRDARRRRQVVSVS